MTFNSSLTDSVPAENYKRIGLTLRVACLPAGAPQALINFAEKRVPRLSIAAVAGSPIVRGRRI